MIKLTVIKISLSLIIFTRFLSIIPAQKSSVYASQMSHTQQSICAFVYPSTIETPSFAITKDNPSMATQLILKTIESRDIDFIETLKLMCMAGVDLSHVDAEGNNLLLLAIKNKKEKIALYLSSQDYFKNPTVLNQHNYAGETALHAAVNRNYTPLIKSILAIEGVCVNTQCALGRTPLLNSISDSEENISLLIARGANPTIACNQGSTPAFFKSILNMPTSSLLAQKIILARNDRGDTQFHLLAKASIEELALRCNPQKTIKSLLETIVETLVEHGLSIWQVNDQCQLPIEIASQKYAELYFQHKTGQGCSFEKLNAHEELFHYFLLYCIANKKEEKIGIYSGQADYLNMETAIAQRYKDNESYYNTYALNYKDQIREKMRSQLKDLPKWWYSFPSYQ
jgi:hypothetical protein